MINFNSAANAQSAREILKVAHGETKAEFIARAAREAAATSSANAVRGTERPTATTAALTGRQGRHCPAPRLARGLYLPLARAA